MDMLGRTGGCTLLINLNSFCVKWRREQKHCTMSETLKHTQVRRISNPALSPPKILHPSLHRLREAWSQSLLERTGQHLRS